MTPDIFNEKNTGVVKIFNYSLEKVPISLK